MKYSKELHDKLRNRTGLHIFNHQVGVDSEDIDAILDEIERLQTEFDDVLFWAAVILLLALGAFMGQSYRC